MQNIKYGEYKHLREEILAGRRFGRFCKNPPN